MKRGSRERRKGLETYGLDINVLGARVDEDLGNVTFLLALKVHLGLIGLDFDKDITRGDFVTNGLLPGTKVTLGHGGGKGGHVNDLVRGIRVRGVSPDQGGEQSRGRLDMRQTV